MPLSKRKADTLLTSLINLQQLPTSRTEKWEKRESDGQSPHDLRPRLIHVPRAFPVASPLTHIQSFYYYIIIYFNSSTNIIIIPTRSIVSCCMDSSSLTYPYSHSYRSLERFVHIITISYLVNNYKLRFIWNQFLVEIYLYIIYVYLHLLLLLLKYWHNIIIYYNRKWKFAFSLLQ